MKTSNILALLFLAGVLHAPFAQAQPDLIWEQNYGLRSGGYAQHITYASEENELVLSGIVTQYDGDEGYNDMTYPVVMKIDGMGETVWVHEGSANKSFKAPVVTRCDWGGYLVIETLKDSEEQTPYYLTAKNLDLETGEVVWERTYPTDNLTSVQAISAWNIPNGRMLVFGWTHPAQFWVEGTNDNVFVMEVSSEDGECFSTTYIEGTERVTLSHVQRLHDGGFLIVGKSGEPEPRRSGKAFAMRIDNQFQPVWMQEFDGTGDDNVTDYAPYEGGFFLLCSNLDAELEIEQSYLIKINLDGDILWNRSLGEDWQTYGNAIDLTGDGGFWIGGHCIPAGENGPNKAWLAWVDTDGELVWQGNMSGENFGNIFDVSSARNGGLFFSGHGPSLSLYSPYSQSVSDPPAVITPAEIVLNGAFPNPFNSTMIVSFYVPIAGRAVISLVDMSGRTVYSSTEEISQPGEVRRMINGGNLASGAYLLRLQQGAAIQTSRLDLLR